MLRQAHTRPEEQIGLLVAVLLHLALAAVLLFQPARQDRQNVEERMTVSLASEVGLEAAAPEPVTESAQALAPVLSEVPVPAPQELLPETPPLPEPEPSTAPPQQAPSASQSAAKKPPKKTSPPQQTPKQTSPQARGGASRIGSNFLQGAGSSQNSSETRTPADQIGPSAKASIVQAISRQLKPHWSAPNGVDAEKLVTILSFQLNEDGSLKGMPRVVGQNGVNPANRAQANLHAERAIRAVRRAAPFDLPDEYYNAWKNIGGARFDRNLSQ